jgi:alpha-1,6-mannosyltransferase
MKPIGKTSEFGNHSHCYHIIVQITKILTDLALNSLLFLVPLFHLLLSPSTKVEESFNLQATHDLLTYGVPLTSSVSLLTSTYDHFTFPGAVPRTFAGAVILSGFSQPIVALVGPENAQYVVRAVLGAFNAAALVFFRRKLGRAFGDGVGRWWVILLVSQFHVVYYLTRTLPNMLAFSLSKSILTCTDTLL